MTPLKLGDVLTVAMAAAQSDCSATVVQKAIARGDLAATRVGQQLFIKPADVDRWARLRSNGRQP
jgi:excisionase family DNA binding protein